MLLYNPSLHPTLQAAG